MSHSPTPWQSESTATDHPYPRLLDKYGGVVACMEIAEDVTGNLDFIVRAVNSHDDLVITLQSAMLILRNCQSGNVNPDLARTVADACDAVLDRAKETP